MKVCLAVIVVLLALPVFAADQAASTRTGPIDEARQLLKGNNPEDVVKILSSYRPAAKESSAYHSLLATALVQLKRPAESIEHFRLAYLYATSKEEKERALFDRAETYKQMTYHSEAVTSYKIFLSKYPQSLLAQRAEFGLAESFYQLGRFPEAIKAYEKSGDSLRALYGKANALHSLGKYKEAHELYLALIKRDKKYLDAAPETVYNIGENLRRMGRLLDAKIYLNSIKDPAVQPRAYVGLGLVAVEEKRYAVAIKLFNEALQSSDRKLRQQTLFLLAETYLKTGEPDEAFPRLLEIRKDYPYGKEYDAAVLLLARLYKSRGKIDETVALLNELICRRIPVPAALEELETILVEMKDKDRAELTRIWNLTGHWLLDPSRTKTIIRIGRVLRHTGKPYLDICKWLIKNGAGDGKAQGRLLLADFYADMGDGAMALQYARRAKITSYDDDVFRAFARVYFTGGEYKNAGDALMKIKKMQEPDALLLIDAVRHMKEPGKALRSTEELLLKKNWSATPYVKLADLLYDRGRSQDALKVYAIAASMKLNGKDTATSAQQAADIEWANYRVSVLSSGERAADALERIQKSKSAVGRFARPDLKGAALSERKP